MSETPPPAPTDGPQKTVRLVGYIPGEVQSLVKRRIKEEKYTSESAYVNGLVIFDLMCRRKHKVTAELMRQPQWVRDEVIAQLVRDYDKPDADRPGGWFDRQIEERVAEALKKGPPADGNK